MTIIPEPESYNIHRNVVPEEEHRVTTISPTVNPRLLRMTDVATKFCPVFYLHSKEKYIPMDFKDIVKGCKLVTLDENNIKDIIFTKDHLKENPNLIVEDHSNNDAISLNNELVTFLDETKSVSSVKNNKYNLIIDDDELKPGNKNQINENNHLTNTSLQCIIGDYQLTGKKHYIYLHYPPTYAFNGTLQPHYWDTELITIRLKLDSAPIASNDDFDNILLNNPRIERIFIASHGYGKWYPIGSRPLDRDLEWEIEFDRVIIYAAKESHASYPKAQIYKRLFRFGDDITNNGIKWDPIDTDKGNNIILLPKPELNGQMGLNHNAFQTYMNRNPDKKIYGFIGYLKDINHGGHNYCTIYRNDLLNVLRYDGFYKFGGGVSYLFDKQLGRPIINKFQILALVLVIVAFIVPAVYSAYDFKTWQIVLFDVLLMFSSVILFITFFF